MLQEEILAVLTMMVGANISSQQLVSIAERTLMEADLDRDELISFEEFARSMRASCHFWEIKHGPKYS